MNKHRWLFLITVAVTTCFLLGIVLMLLATPSTPQTPEIRRQGALEMRAMDGDITALRELYHGNFYPSAESVAHLALEGAALGDWEFQKIYFEYFLKLPKQERLDVLRAERQILRGPKASCYLDMLARETLSAECSS